ncbi:nicolin-1 isoform X2 [Nycticebus coucang]|uniref:nicolin-1 isoform X2 n=1 Tax=Nycticebus coucang TaxID=9470 RepID=UPI00234C4798|nr:nicolin-1 isoform X2 [Nycticebus coucang]
MGIVVHESRRWGAGKDCGLGPKLRLCQVAAGGIMSRVSVPCHVKGTIALQVGDVRTSHGRPGVLVIDVSFPSVAPFQLQEIMFKNYYTAFLSIRVRQHTSMHTPAKWVTCLRNYCLMPDPHSEEGAQEYVSLFKHQPSPLWLSFTVEELQIYQQGPKSPSMTFPKWLSHPVPCEQPVPLLEGLPDPSRVSSEVQQMWALTEMIRASHTSARIGRFDVDGCYDLNLLSYT